MQTMKKFAVASWLSLGALGCSSGSGGTEATTPPSEPPGSEASVPELGEEPDVNARSMPEAAGAVEVSILPRSASTLSGTARFESVPQGVKVAVKVLGAPPGEHGAHIHQSADCSAADASSAGAHFNPDGHDHGKPGDSARHLGDLGNLIVQADGTGTLEILIEGSSLEPDDPHSILGRGLIIHAQKDDGSQPSGNSGARIGCAEITR
jgi:Cu-Zn family superoxide dismutase